MGFVKEACQLSFSLERFLFVDSTVSLPRSNLLSAHVLVAQRLMTYSRRKRNECTHSTCGVQIN